MVFYWGLFSIPLLWGLLPEAERATRGLGVGLLALLLALAIGLRFEVGCDWTSYVLIYEMTERLPLWQALLITDPGYQVFDILAGWTGSIYLVNVASAVVFTFGLFAFINRQPLPWLTLLCSIPYVVTVVGMGYQRQSMALGMVMLAMNAFTDRRTGPFLFYVLVGASFHKSALVLLPLTILVHGFRLRLSVILFLGLTIALGGAFIASEVDLYYKHYVTVGMASQGALTRVIVTMLAAVLFLIRLPEFRKRYRDTDLFFYLSIVALACVPLVLISSTAVDRLALYLLPYQIAIFSRLPQIFQNTVFRMPIVAGVIFSYAALFYVWLNYSPEAGLCWAHYRNVLFINSGGDGA